MLGPTSKHRGVIICVDDEAMILTSLREQLREVNDWGFSVEVTTDGEDALELLDELLIEGEQVPLFISDQIMPGIKGDELLKRVKERSPETRGVLLTGQADLRAVERAVNQANLYRYLSKPWEQSDLLMTVRSAIESFLTDQELIARQCELQETNKVFRRFVPEPFLRRIATKGVTGIEVGYGELVEVTILFSDIRGFTSISEQMSPPNLMRMLNSYFAALSEPIHQNGGFIDKYIGDAIMAIFDGPNHAQRALEAAVDMQRALTQWNQKQSLPLRSGIGLHSGEVVIGTVGTHKRMDSTVLGDNVNLCARLEGLTKEHGHPIIVSKQTLDFISHHDEQRSWEAHLLGSTQVKGRMEAVEYYHVTERASDQTNQ